MSRVPHPGHVTMASGFSSGPIVDLQRGQFIEVTARRVAGGPEGRV